MVSHVEGKWQVGWRNVRRGVDLTPKTPVINIAGSRSSWNKQTSSKSGESDFEFEAGL